MQGDQAFELPTRMSIVARTADGKTTILQHLLVSGLLTPDQYAAANKGHPMVDQCLEAEQHLR